jgi:DNA-binding SARP family transcriptional activator
VGLRVVLAGRLGVEVDGQEKPVRLGSRQVRLAFVVLVCERRRAVPPDELAEVLWAGAPPASWPASLRKVLSGVRAALSEAGLPPAESLRAAFGCYQLRLPAGATVDLEEAAEGASGAEAALAAGDAARAAQAAEAASAVLRLPLLAGVDVPWLDAKQAELQALHVRSLEALAGARLALGQAEPALAAAGQAVALDPYRESAHRLVMAAHAGAGRRGAALRAYEACRRLLAEELGVAPSSETQSVYAELLGEEGPGDAGADLTPSAPPSAGDARVGTPPAPRPVAPLPAALAPSPAAGFHGRARELEALAGAFKEAAAGERRVALVAGEAGMGKTALVAEAARAAHEAGATVLYGRCDEDIGFAYLPWVEALTHLVSHAPPDLLGRLGPHRAHLARLVPVAVESLDDLPAAPPADPEAERYLLFRSVLAALQAAAAEARVVVVLDDLHWADKGTLMLLRHVVAAPEPLALLVVGAYRHQELAGAHPLADVLAALRREPGVQRVTLAGLSDLELLALVEAAAGHSLGEAEVALAHAVHRESGGHPFFAWELLRHLVETGAVARAPDGAWRAGEADERLPDSVREVVGRRVDRLGEEVRRALSHAAVIGSEFQLPVLAAALGADPDHVLDALEAAEAAGLVTTTSAGSFRFAHALVAHTLYQDLTPTRRARAHRRVAQALEELGLADERVGELARHWAAATMSADAAKAADYARRAGERALAALAPAEALRWYRQALELWDQDPARDGRMRCELLLGLGEAERQAGDAAFRQTLLEAAGLAQDLDDGERLVRAALANNRGAPQGLDPERSAVVVDAALAAVGEADSAARARLLATRAVALTHAADHLARMRAAQEAVAVARRVGDPRALLAVLNDAAPALAVPETLEERLALTAEATALADVLQDPAAGFFAHLQRAQVALEAAEVAEADRCLARMATLAEEVGQPTLRWMAAWAAGSRTLLAGDAEEAERLAEAALQLGGDTGQPDALMIYGGQLFCIRWHQGRDAELVELIAGVAGDSPDLPVLRAGLARLLLDAGRHDEVVVDLAEVAAIPYNIAWAVAIATWAEVAARLRALDACAFLYDRLLPYSAHVLNLHAVCTGTVAHYLGLLAQALADDEAAEGHFAEAEAVCEALRAPFHLARARLAWGRLLLQRRAPGDLERAETLLAEALAAAKAHGCGGLERQAAQALEIARRGTAG